MVYSFFEIITDVTLRLFMPCCGYGADSTYTFGFRSVEIDRCSL